MKTKLCKKCLQEKPLDQFYVHQQMRDGRLSKCKECTKDDVRENRDQNLDYYQNYDRVRYDEGRHPTNENGTHCKHTLHSRKWTLRNPLKRKAELIATKEIESGELVRARSCSACGRNDLPIEAHHADYTKPLDVTWLCTECHGKTRKKSRATFHARRRGGFKGPMVPSRAA